jgi:hypothetical protein
VHHDGITLFNWPSAEDPRIGLGYLLINFVVLAFLIHRLIIRKLVDDNTVRHEGHQASGRGRDLEPRRGPGRAHGLQVPVWRASTRRASRSSRRPARPPRPTARRLVAEAELEVERFKAGAMAAAAREVAQRRAEIEGEVVDRAIARATELLTARFNDADHSRLVDDYAVSLADNRAGATARA